MPSTRAALGLTSLLLGVAAAILLWPVSCTEHLVVRQPDPHTGEMTVSADSYGCRSIAFEVLHHEPIGTGPGLGRLRLTLAGTAVVAGLVAGGGAWLAATGALRAFRNIEADKQTATRNGNDDTGDVSADQR